MSEKLNPFQQLIAQALQKADEEMIRAVLAEVLTKALDEYDCRNIITAVVQPIAAQIARQLMEDPQVLEALQQRVRSQMFAFASSFAIRPPDRY